jgi:ubiquinone/menaquinone biosynthesis C-methylase UbiE
LDWDKAPTFPKDYSQDNLQFVQGDILNGFEDDSFDLVHVGFLFMDFTGQQ